MQLTKRQEALIRTLSSRHGRRGSEFCICDGLRSSREILHLRPDLVEILILRDGVGTPEESPVEPVILSGPEFERVSRTVVNSQGIIVVARRPEMLPPEAPVSGPFALLLDRVGDPGNVGTILRTARAAGLREVWMTRGCADPYSDKVVRSASGAQFALAVREYGALEEVVALLRARGIRRVFRTAPGGGRSVFTEQELFTDSVVVLGSEGAGAGEIPGAVNVLIPMPGDAESLNVAQAATVILFEHVRRTCAAAVR